MSAARRRAAALFAGRSRRPRILAALLVVTSCGYGAPARVGIGEVTTAAAPDDPGARVARVEIRNDGGGELLLHGVRLGCGCRVVSPLPDALAGGERATLAVRCRNDATAATRLHEIFMLSSDPDRSEIVIPLVLPHDATPGPEPGALYFGYVAVGSSMVRDVVLPPDGPGTVTSLPESMDPALTMERRPSRADGRRVLGVRFTPRTSGPFRAAVHLGGTSGTLQVSGVGYRGLIALPAEITLPTETSGGGLPAIAIKSVGAAPVAITSVETPAGLTGELQTSSEREARLILRARAAHSAGAILVHTTSPDEPVLTIPVHDGST